MQKPHAAMSSHSGYIWSRCISESFSAKSYGQIWSIFLKIESLCTLDDYDSVGRFLMRYLRVPAQPE